MSEEKQPYWLSETPAQFADGFTEEVQLHQAESLQEVEVERYEANQLIGQRWRIHSYHDGESIALTDQGMRELLDLLLCRAGEFSAQAEDFSSMPPIVEQDETPDDWQPRA